MKITTTITAALATALLASAAYAQDYVPGPPVRSPMVWQSHSSTIGEGWLRGRADLARAAGEYNYNTSLAAINMQEARSRAMDNAKKRTQTYFEMRAINREARAQERRPRLTNEEISQMARDKAPDRLAAHQYEPALGKAFWPAALMQDKFADERTAIDSALAKNRVGVGEQPSYGEFKQQAEQLRDKLKSEIDSMSTSEYIACVKFLRGLDMEMRFPQTNISGLAAK